MNLLHTHTETGEKHASFSLLVGGRQAFPEILSCIEKAQKSLLINMFIWRDDKIGNCIAEAILHAAERGVKVELSVDRYGVVLEKCEESKRSFFHKNLKASERIKIFALERFYPMPNTPKHVKDGQTPLAQAILTHPNIRVSADEWKADHSKFYVIDGEILIMGGMNIEDKENGMDRQGRVYGDYMVKLMGKSYVQAFFEKREHGTDTAPDCQFEMNVKKPMRRFEMQERYLEQIRGAKRELRIIMSYFSPLPQFVNAIVQAHQRGVKVTVMIPMQANFQNDSNRKTAKKLWKKTNGEIKLLLSPKMLHTKLIETEERVSFGSANITKKAFRQLSELNFSVENGDTPFLSALHADMDAEFALAQEVTSQAQLSYRRFTAFLEGFLV